MPPDRCPQSDPDAAPARRRASFRERYDALERRRQDLIARLARLDERARRSPSSARALTLLNATFRKSKLVQRAAVLQAAQWLIELAERFSSLA